MSMPEEKKTLIMKFGGSTLQDSKSFHRIAELIARRLDGSRIVVVLSAMHGVTDRLIALAHSIHPHPPRREYDMLISVGERVSISLLAMALHTKNIDALSFTGSQSGVMTTNDHTDAKIIAVHPHRLTAALDRGQVAIVAGFQGVSQEKEITTLGRGGSDTTAVALGVALRASVVEFYKDVSGIFPCDPKQGVSGEPYRHLTFEEAIGVIERTGGRVLHMRALALAAANGLPLSVLPFWGEGSEGTRIDSTITKTSIPKRYESSLSTHCHCT